jgi:hypothetical protein
MTPGINSQLSHDHGIYHPDVNRAECIFQKLTISAERVEETDDLVGDALMSSAAKSPP